ncbi:hypothetical protein [Ruminococcus sp. NK3A76]|uniref:hypothetical protein n=1 Tax=Ruminococcus sp. NK3A76 TaxID=877411 RepID=UPI0004917A6D|nr:hypothetical protein [Ruminococcus sp. NK3A76]
MNRINVYLKAKDDLEKLANKQDVDISKYYKPGFEKIYGDGINHYFYLFCGHDSDRQYMGNIVKFYNDSSDTQEILSDILYGFDPKKTTKNYTNVDNLIDKLKEEYPNKIENEKKWNEYLTGIYQCAVFLSNGKIGGKELTFDHDHLLKEPENIEEFKKYLYDLRYIKNNIAGVGPAVCYNWLKECGAIWLAKPDLHIKRVVAELLKTNNTSNDHDKSMADKVIQKYINNHREEMRFPELKGIKKNSRLTCDEYVALYMWEWAKEIREKGFDKDCSAYKLDRVLYLFCTNGHFYLDDNSNNEISEDKLLDIISE